MKNEFLNHIENEVKNYKLYKLQNIDQIKREYDKLKDFIKVDKVIYISKNIWIIMLFIVLIIFSISTLYFVFNLHSLQLFFQTNDVLSKILLFLISILTLMILYLFYDKIHKNNSLYKLDKLFVEYFRLIKDIEHEEKIKYETFVDYLIKKEQNRR